MKQIEMNYGGSISVLKQNGYALPYIELHGEIGECKARAGFKSKEGVKELIRQLQEVIK